MLAVSCSACTWLLRTQYADYGVPLRPRILHVSELLAPYAEALPVPVRWRRSTITTPVISVGALAATSRRVSSCDALLVVSASCPITARRLAAAGRRLCFP